MEKRDRPIRLIQRIPQIDKLISQYADCCSFTGAVLVSEHDKVIFKKGYGLANREWNIPNTPEVKFRLASITKQFTSMLIMQQVAKGTIKLDGHLTDYLPYYRQDTGSKVTIAQLLSHTSGIPDYTDAPKPDLRIHYSVDDFVKKFCSGDLQFEPGTKYRYDNHGYFLLGAILEHVAGKTYEELLKENIFVPLGMKDSGYDHPADILAKRASGYEQDLAGVVNAAPLLETGGQPYAAGASIPPLRIFISGTRPSTPTILFPTISSKSYSLRICSTTDTAGPFAPYLPMSRVPGEP